MERKQFFTLSRSCHVLPNFASFCVSFVFRNRQGDSSNVRVVEKEQVVRPIQRHQEKLVQPLLSQFCHQKTCVSCFQNHHKLQKLALFACSQFRRCLLPASVLRQNWFDLWFASSVMIRCDRWVVSQQKLRAASLRMNCQRDVHWKSSVNQNSRSSKPTKELRKEKQLGVDLQLLPCVGFEYFPLFFH